MASSVSSSVLFVSFVVVPCRWKNPENHPFRGTGGRRTLMVYEGGTNGCSRAGNTRVGPLGNVNTGPLIPGGSLIQSEVGRANDRLIIEYHVPTG